MGDNGVRPNGLFVREVGDGRPIVVVHGGPDFDHVYLLPELDRLTDAGRVIYYDQRGRGRSVLDRPVSEITIATEVADLDSVRASFGAPSVAVVGHSWGGLLALEYAIAHPDRVSHLILVNSAPASHRDVGELRVELSRRRSTWQSHRLEELRRDPRFLAGDLELDAEYHRIHFAAALRDPDLLETLVGRLRSAVTPEVVVTSRQIEARLYEVTWARHDYDLLPALGGLAVPTLVLHGDDDFIPTAVVRRIVDAIPGAQLVELEDCGHFAYLEQPDRTFATIASFLASR